jgi:rhodanese-related sulfurtransferase/glyoxylase-like metal-dependent hydrolase (beta-lactamase superfamily II)
MDVMEVVPFVREGLGNSSYLVGFDGLAVMVDPDRTAQRYIDEANRRGWRIIASLETHLHADFITGSRELADALEAETFISSEAFVQWPHRGVMGGDRVMLDGLDIQVIASPGHSPESVSYVMRTASSPLALFSGGALTAGSAARTDLVSPHQTEPLTRALFKTLRTAYNDLPDDTLLFPTHGGGSFCTAGAATERTSTLGRERQTNPVLLGDEVEEFLDWFPLTFPNIPAYFAHMRSANQKGPRLKREMSMLRAMDAAEFREAALRGVIVDPRKPAEYARRHIAGSVSIPYRDVFATWLGWIVPLGTPLFFVPGDTDVEDLVDECLLVGHEGLGGVLQGGVEAWARAGYGFAETRVVGNDEAKTLAAEGAWLLDVREPDEYAGGRIANAVSIPLGELQSRIAEVPRDEPVLVYCGAGQRSMTAASLLERAGIRDVTNLRGGIEAWRGAGEPVRI